MNGDVKNQNANKSDIKELKNDIKELKSDIKELLNPINTRLGNIETDVRELHNKFDTINHRTGRHGSFIWIYGIVLGLILSGIITKAFQLLG